MFEGNNPSDLLVIFLVLISFIILLFPVLSIGYLIEIVESMFSIHGTGLCTTP